MVLNFLIAFKRNQKMPPAIISIITQQLILFIWKKFTCWWIATWNFIGIFRWSTVLIARELRLHYCLQGVSQIKVGFSWVCCINGIVLPNRLICRELWIIRPGKLGAHRGITNFTLILWKSHAVFSCIKSRSWWFKATHNGGWWLSRPNILRLWSSLHVQWLKTSSHVPRLFVSKKLRRSIAKFRTTIIDHSIALINLFSAIYLMSVHLQIIKPVTQ